MHYVFLYIIGMLFTKWFNEDASAFFVVFAPTIILVAGALIFLLTLDYSELDDEDDK